MAKTSKRRWQTGEGQERVAWRVTYTDSAGQRHQLQFPTKKIAEEFRTKIENQLATGMYRADANKTKLREICELYLDHCEGRMNRDERMTRKTFAVYRGHVSNYLLNSNFAMADQKLSHITPRRVGDFRDKLRQAGVTVPTTRKILATFHTILEFAISQDFIATNAVRGITVIGPRDEGSRKIVPPSKAEMRSLIESINWDARTKVIFAGATGVRAGEQWALRWSDVDLDNRQVNIRRRIDAYGREEPPKSASGVRTIPLSDHLARTLMEWRIQTGFSLEDDFVFVNKNGRHVCHDNFVKRRFKPALNRAGLSPHVNWHSLRHFAISTWIEAGLAPKTIMTFAGHTSIQLTMDRYGHMFPSDDHQVVMNVIANDLFI